MRFLPPYFCGTGGAPAAPRPIAGAGHQASPMRETGRLVLLTGGSLASVVAVVLVLWGLFAWKH